MRSRQNTHLSFQAGRNSLMGTNLLDLSELEGFEMDSTTKAMRNVESRIARKTYQMNMTQ